MVHLRLVRTGPPPAHPSPETREKKTASLSQAFDELFEKTSGAFRDRRVHRRAHALAQANSVCLGRRTVSGLLAACGRQFEDWSASYRLFERQRFLPDRLFAVPLQAVTEHLAPEAPLVAVMDDTLFPKKGRRMSATAWHHDPQGPFFAHQITWSQRAVELCAMLPATTGGACSARAVPVDLALQPSRPKPSARATEQQKQLYARFRRETAIPNLAVKRVHALRDSLARSGQLQRQVLLAVDGGYTNKTLLANLPSRTALIGRLRKDAKLFAPPPATGVQRGRPKLYGQPLPTPEQLLLDPSTGWQTVSAFAAGQLREFHCKTFDCCRWPKVAGGRDLRVVVVRPLSRTPHERGRRLFFAHPGYLVCSDPSDDVAQIIQAYVWRWEIEVGFRDQKTHLGLGQPQCRTPLAAERVVQFQAFVYALLLLAAHRCGLTAPPRAKWQAPLVQPQRCSILQILSSFRSDLWGLSWDRPIKTHFVSNTHPSANPRKFLHSLSSAVLYAG